MTHQTRRGSRVAQTYSIPLEELNESKIEERQTHLTLQARSSFGVPPPAFSAWFVQDGRLHMPRFYGLEHFGPAEQDARVDGDAVALSFTGTLTPVQERATSAVETRFAQPHSEHGALVCLPCGYGKTVWAVSMIARLGRKAVVFVHKSFLRDQWEQAFRNFCPGVRVGYIQGKVWKVEDCDVVIAMVMTMAKRDIDPDVLDCFGTLCFDECHHMAAPVMNLATRCFRGRYILGLTATKERPDGLTPLLHWSLGPEVFRVERDTERVQVTVALFAGGSPEILNRDGKPVMSIMINRLAACEPRNRFIADRIVALHSTGRVLIVLSDRIKQLETLRAMVLAREVDPLCVGLFTGATREADRPEQLARQIVMCSYGMANEGLDKREADTCIMATPKGRVTQCIGRIQRPCETKQTPLVVDIADDASVFARLRWKRQRIYSAERYEVQVLQATSAEGWFA